MTTNIREQLGFTAGFHTICREERNVAAIFYHLLLHPGGLQRFLDFIECDFAVSDAEAGVFFEYSYLRDLWDSQVHGDNDKARKLVSAFLGRNRYDLESKSTEEWNRFFGVGGTPSRTDIQNPGKWSIKKYGPNIDLDDGDFFQRVCKFKWSFNAKPDIVIHTDSNTAVCIEAKVDSREGSYPSSADDKAEFQRRNLRYVGQTELQRYILEDLLGFRTKFLFLVQDKKAKSDTHQTVTWKQVFTALDHAAAPRFVQQWVARL